MEVKCHKLKSVPYFAILPACVAGAADAFSKRAFAVSMAE